MPQNLQVTPQASSLALSFVVAEQCLTLAMPVPSLDKAFAVETDWSEKGSFKLKVKATKPIRKYIEKLVDHTVQQQWLVHDELPEIPGDPRLYRRASEAVYKQVLRAVVQSQIKKVVEEFVHGI